MNDFFRTGMGHKFYEGTMPELVYQLKILNMNLDRLATAVERARIVVETKDNEEMK